jgi:hypothetical protein
MLRKHTTPEIQPAKMRLSSGIVSGISRKNTMPTITANPIRRRESRLGKAFSKEINPLLTVGEGDVERLDGSEEESSFIDFREPAH